MLKIKELSHPDDLPVGFDYYYGKPYQAIPVGKRLSLFFSKLYSNQVINAIEHIKIFIQYIIDYVDPVTMNRDAFCDLVSLMEFKISLVFATGPGYCDFCLPRAYLVNYFDAFNVKPLIPSQYKYKRDNYYAEVKNSMEQIQQLLETLIYNEWSFLTIILRLVRLLVLIGRNDSNFASKIFNIFKDLNSKVSSTKIKKYSEESNMGRLVSLLKDDLKETGCDSLVIVHYHWGGISRFAELEKSGVTMLKYNSIEGFRSSLKMITSSVDTEESAEIDVPANQLLPQRADVGEQNTDPMPASNEDEEDERQFAEIQSWFRQIQNSPEAQEAAKKIQGWFPEAHERRQKSRQFVHDKILENIYKDVRDFCQDVSHWEFAVNQKGESAVRMYHMFLRGFTVDIIVKLTKLQDRTNRIKNKLKTKINDSSVDETQLESCLELEDELKYIHYENIKLQLESLSTTGNTEKHEEADIEWLEVKLQEADTTIGEVEEWIDKCKDTIRL